MGYVINGGAWFRGYIIEEGFLNGKRIPLVHGIYPISHVGTGRLKTVADANAGITTVLQMQQEAGTAALRTTANGYAKVTHEKDLANTDSLPLRTTGQGKTARVHVIHAEAEEDHFDFAVSGDAYLGICHIIQLWTSGDSFSMRTAATGHLLPIQVKSVLLTDDISLQSNGAAHVTVEAIGNIESDQGAVLSTQSAGAIARITMPASEADETVSMGTTVSGEAVSMTVSNKSYEDYAITFTVGDGSAAALAVSRCISEIPVSLSTQAEGNIAVWCYPYVDEDGYLVIRQAYSASADANYLTIE